MTTTLNSFLLVYALVRVLGHDVYPVAVLISSLGSYVMATDLGYSGFVYFRTRQSFLAGTPADGSQADAVALYLSIALLCAAAACLGIALLVAAPAGTRGALALYFLSIVLALPWNLLRRVSAAVDLYLTFECYEAVRRVVFLGLALMMLHGLSFAGFALACLAAWSAAFLVAARVLRARAGIDLAATSPRAALAHLRANRRNIGAAGSLTALEFAIYNFPYLVIPAVFADAGLLVAFDLFYKVVRFGAVSYAVPAESVLPAQTRAFYGHDRAGVLRGLRAAMLLGALPLAAGGAVLYGWGDRLFSTLLAGSHVVGSPLRLAMAAMLAALLLKESVGTFLIATGNYRQLAPFALATLCLMACLVGAALVLGLSFASFMYGYVAIFALHCLLFGFYFRRFTAVMP